MKSEVLTKSSFKSSQEKSLRKHILESIPNLSQIIDELWPKKANLFLAKLKPYFFTNQ